MDDELLTPNDVLERNRLEQEQQLVRVTKGVRNDTFLDNHENSCGCIVIGIVLFGLLGGLLSIFVKQ